MHLRSTRLNFIVGALFIVVMGACGNLGGCGACGATQPLPPPGNAPQVHNMPSDQTVEGGAQIRVTPAGFNKLTALLPGLLNDSIGGGFCIPDGDVSLAGLPLASYCFNNQGQCTPGCRIVPTLNSTSVSVTNQNELNVRVSLDVDVNIPIDTIITSPCTVRVTTLTTSDIIADVNIALGIKPADGELDVHVVGINNLDLGGIRFISNGGTACDIAAGAGNFLSIILDFIADNLSGLITPIIDDLIQGFLPSPLGIAGMMDVGQLLAGVSPGTDASMEARITPGGYARLKGNGLSLGVITGLNADEDVSTRDVGLTSEPHLCVPPLPAPNFGAPPANLPVTSRSTFALGVANEFDGVPEPAGADLAMGVSETTLDLAGHHAVTSGMMCLGIGTQFINQLNVGTIGILVPSVAELQSDNGNDPLLLVTRPTRPLDFTIGDNNATLPALTIHISHLEVDFYAFLYERYTRVFTLDLSMNVGINLEFEQPAGMPAVIKPTLVGISSDQVELTVLNSEFVRETPQDLEAILPSIFDLVTPLLGDLPPINVPSFAGFSLENLQIAKVTTAQDDFLALNATLGASQALRQLGATNHLTQDVIRRLDAQLPDRLPQSKGRATLARVVVPDPAKVRAALTKTNGGAMPAVEFTVDRFDAGGRELEWAYNLNGGMFRPYTMPGVDGKLIVADRAFAWQGKYTIGLKSRVKGDYHTVSETTYHVANIDSVPPRFLLDKAEWRDDGDYHLTIFDIVSGNIVLHALGKPSGSVPETTWSEGGYAQWSRDELERFAEAGEVAVYAKDEAGNVSVTLIAPFHGQPGEAGCNCDASGAPSTGGMLLALLVGVVLVTRRRRRPLRLAKHARVMTNAIAFVGLSITLSVVPGCSCNDAPACELFSDCADCPPGQIPFCIEGTCQCSDDIIMGKLGAYQDVAAGPAGEIWVSAYHQQYGDLVVTQVPGGVGRIPDEIWEWVDGVPDGPVIVPQSAYRHGIAEKGVDVGMYTSIAVGPDGTPMVTYFDRDAGSLKFAARVGGVWQNHVIEAGSGELGETGALIGMYTSMSLRSDDGRPGVAYLAHVSDAQNGPRAEVRFAAAQVAIPTSAADWMTWVVDTAPLPPVDANSPDIYPLPSGLGLFVDLTRAPDQQPIVVYYDRAGGELRMARFNAGSGQFDAPIVLDGNGDLDAGWSPTVAVDANGTVQVAYVNATSDDLMFVKEGTAPELVDDGRRIVGTTVDGLPKPEYHFIGDDASLVMANAGTVPMIVYQDATTHEMLLGTKLASGTWNIVSIAGATDPWPGGYGFFAADVLFGTEIIMSTWVIDQPHDDNWIEVFRRQTGIQ